MNEAPWELFVSDWRDFFQKKLHPLLQQQLQDIPILYKINKQMTDDAGQYTTDPHTIWLSPYQKVEEAKETFGHEFAHFGVRICWGEQPDPHGFLWKSMMETFGLSSYVNHNMPLKERKCAVDGISKIMERIDEYGKKGKSEDSAHVQ